MRSAQNMSYLPPPPNIDLDKVQKCAKSLGSTFVRILCAGRVP